MKARHLFFIALGLLALWIIYMLLLPTPLAWDASVYIGMGRYIASAGNMGLWEVYRPPLLPLLYSVGVLLNIPIGFAIAMTIAGSAGALYFAYRIGEHYRETAGGWASIALASAPLFTTFSTIPTTEVFGVVGFLAAYYLLFVRRRYFAGGVITALLFVLRFPYGLLLPLFGISILIETWYQTKHRAVTIKHLSYYSGGLLIVLVPYLISNTLLYDGALLPILEGARVAHDVGFLYHQHVLFYVGILIAGAPLVLASPAAFYKSAHNKGVIAILGIIALVFLAYFTYEAHKEPRYSMPVLAPLVLLAGLGLARIFSRRITPLTRTLLVSGVIVLIIGGYIASSVVQIGLIKDRSLESYYKTFRQYPGATVLSTTPAIVAFAPIRLVGAYTSFEQYTRVFEKHRESIDRLYINSCDLVQCQAGDTSCVNEAAAALDTLAPAVAFTTIARHGTCQILLGEVKKK